MKKFVLVLLAALAGVPVLCASSSEHTLFSDGKSSYSIVIPADASVSETTAAGELRNYIKGISGATLPILTGTPAKGPAIYVGYCEKTAKKLKVARPNPQDESFTYCSKGDDIYIWGGSEAGTMYGVFSFLEQQFGVRWYSPAFTVVPGLGSWSFEKLHHSETPAILRRQTNYYSTSRSPEWNYHNKMNLLWSPVDSKYGHISAYWGAHTMGWLVPSKEFFSDHPEYFSEVDGKRIPNGQLCLSNPDVLQICKERLLKVIEENPGYWVYSLSQLDNKKRCTCGRCRALEEEYGGPSGILIWFVNQVAEEVEKLYPDKYVGTFAYQYTRKAPGKIVPRENVVIRLCDIECCFAHPLGGCPKNKSFIHDLQEWGKICNNVFIWDYVVNYAQYLAPFPNFSVIGPNVKTFSENNVIGLFEEAQYNSAVAEFPEMRAWMVSKLLWNPEQDTEALARDFISGYYGSVAPYIQEYYDMTQDLVKEDTHFNIYIKHDNPLYTDEYVDAASKLLSRARMAAANERERYEVDKVRMQILYLRILRNREQSLEDGTFEEFSSLVRKTGARISEVRDFDRFIRDFGYPPYEKK